jgi:hypothetical protein
VWPIPGERGLEVLWDRKGMELVEMLGSWSMKATIAAIPGNFQILVS